MPLHSYTLVFRNEQRRVVKTTRRVLIILKIVLIPVVIVSQIPLWWLLAAILAIVSVIEYRAIRVAPSVMFSENGIMFIGMFKKKYTWKDVANVIVKDELLTVDFKNNRLVQKEIETHTDEQQFNKWCANHLGVGT